MLSPKLDLWFSSGARTFRRRRSSRECAGVTPWGVLAADCRFSRSVEAADTLEWYDGTGLRVGFRRTPPTFVDVLRLIGSALTPYGLVGLVGLDGLVGAPRGCETAIGVDVVLLPGPAYACAPRSLERWREWLEMVVAVVEPLLFAAAVFSFASATARVLDPFDGLRARRGLVSVPLRWGT